MANGPFHGRSMTALSSLISNLATGERDQAFLALLQLGTAMPLEDHGEPQVHAVVLSRWHALLVAECLRDLVEADPTGAEALTTLAEALQRVEGSAMVAVMPSSGAAS